MKEYRLSWIFLSPIVLAVLMMVTILILDKSLPPLLPLFYSLPWGENQLATHQQFLSLPSIVAGICLINLMMYLRLPSSQAILKNILVFSSVLSSLILAISLVKIISLFL